jgi:probable F420-dependent oxidoreductase
MRFGIHLPQFGRASGPDAIARAARQAEELGYDDVWVSDHLVVPADQGYPNPYLYDPIIALTWAAAATTRVGLGTSVLVLPQHNPVALANALASLDAMSGGRLTVGGGVGWSAGEFAALGQSFADRGARTDEIIELLRACWQDDPVNFDGQYYSLRNIRLLPKPSHDIPIWVGGRTEPAWKRAVERADGFHGIGLEPEDVPPVLARLRQDRPEETFTFSLRVDWDGLRHDPEMIVGALDAYARAGVQHLMTCPSQGNLDDWLRSVESLWRTFSRYSAG